MAKIAFVFSGQGAQYSGMGKELYETSAAAKTVFDQADVIRPGTTRQCFYGDKEELSQTINTQPCLFCVDLAAACALADFGIVPQALAGFSLGEIAALTFAETFDFEQGFGFVCKRAAFMHEASLKSNSTMVAVLKMVSSQVEALCKKYDGIYPVNYNAPGQTVVALTESMKADFCAAVAEMGGKAMPLAVSGAFHSPYMDEAKKKLLITLSEMEPQAPVSPVYANRNALPYGNTVSDVKENIACQVNRPVLWQKTVENMIADGIDTFVEVGAGKTLCNLIKKISPEVRILHVEDAQSLMEAVHALKPEAAELCGLTLAG